MTHGPGQERNPCETRSVNTSVTTALALGAILIWGGASVQSFVLALFLGVVIGTYSSIFIASPILVNWQNIISQKHKTS